MRLASLVRGKLVVPVAEHPERSPEALLGALLVERVVDVGDEEREGDIQAFSPTVDALYVPDIDSSLDEEGAKQRFWKALRMLGEWYDELPPY